MHQTAIFVDAGYLFAQGSAAVSGSKVARHRLRLNVASMLSELLLEARNVETSARLLRVYWYDGVARTGSLTPEQRSIADAENVKCRFGIINSAGEQKGVDSLIVTDMIELARGKAISDALILAGDEDLRVGVQVAQSFGIRVHLLGIHPARGSQSPDLRAEVDTRIEWGPEKVAGWLTILDDSHADAATQTNATSLEEVLKHSIDELSVEQSQSIVVFAEANRSQLPADFDRPLLGKARTALGRDLDHEERRALRVNALEEIKKKAVSAAA